VDFILKEKKGSQMVTRIEIHVHVGQSNAADAAKLATNKKLSDENMDLLNGPAARRAMKLPAGTTNDARLNKMVVSAVSGN
jgi:hypothetical protein